MVAARRREVPAAATGPPAAPGQHRLVSPQFLCDCLRESGIDAELVRLCHSEGA